MEKTQPKQYLCNISAYVVRCAQEEAKKRRIATGVNVTWQSVVREWTRDGMPKQ